MRAPSGTRHPALSTQHSIEDGVQNSTKPDKTRQNSQNPLKTHVPTASAAQSRNMLKKLALVVPLALLLVYFVNWTRELEANRGLEGIVRRADFVSTLTGALV